MTPERWQQQVLGEAIELISGQHVAAALCNDIGVGVPYLTGPSDFPNGRIVVTRYVEQPKVLCEPGDVLLTVKGSGAGKSVVADGRYAIGRQLMALRPVSIDAKYLALIVDYHEADFGDASSGVIPGISRGDVLEFPLLLPPENEQKVIAQLLETWERTIQKTVQQVAELRERKRGLMEALLTGKKRFKEFNSTPWKRVSLSRLGRVATGGTPSTRVPDYWNGNHAWCTPSEVTALKSRYIDSTARHLTEEGLRAGAVELLPPGSLIVCTRATIGDSAINAIPMAMNQGFKALVPRNDVDVEFLYYKIVHEKPALLRLATGSTFLEVSKRDFEGLEIEVPCLTEQKKIASLLSTADSEIENLEQQLAAYKLQKSGLMQQLLTGKKRVKVDVPEAVLA